MNTKNRSSRVLVAAAIAVFALSASTASAALTGQLGILGGGGDLTGQINPATGVAWQKGDTYRFIFSSSAGRDATSANIADYNAFVKGLADASPLGLSSVDWRAMGSTDTVDARDNTSTNQFGGDGTGESFWLLDGSSLVADNYADLYGSGTHTSAITVSETGGAPFDGGDFTSVWTGSNGAGTKKFGGGFGGDNWLGPQTSMSRRVSLASRVGHTGLTGSISTKR